MWACNLCRDTPVKFIIENVMMDHYAMDEVSRAVSCTPIRLTAARQDAKTSGRQYWVNWEFAADESEFVVPGRHYTQIRLRDDAACKLAPALARLVRSLLVINSFVEAASALSTWTLLPASLPFPPQSGALADLREEAEVIANRYTYLMDDFVEFAKIKGLEEEELGADVGASRDRCKLAASMGFQRT